jgi:hypothetical protein
LYDNHKILLNKRAGGDYGAEVRYGKNMDGISFKEDMSNVVTRIVPIAYNGRMITSKYVDSPLINKYAKKYIKEIRFDDVKLEEDLADGEDTKNIIVCKTQSELDNVLRQKCDEQFLAGIDMYSVTIDVDLIALENTVEYQDFKDMVRIGLGDTVRCYNNKLGVSTEARAIRIVWDCITDTAREVKLGDYEVNFISELNSTVLEIERQSSEGNVLAERILGVLDGTKVQMKIQATETDKPNVRMIMFENVDPDSGSFGAISFGTQGIQIADSRTEDGHDWNWRDAITVKGVIYPNEMSLDLLDVTTLRTIDAEENVCIGTNGEFTTVDGMTVTITNGIITDIQEVEIKDEN